jgi:hypothetical protein
MFYWLILLFSAFTIVMYFLSGVVPMGLIDPKPLVGHVQFLQYSFGRGFSVLSWLYLLVVGSIMLKLDPGSQVNAMLSRS